MTAHDFIALFEKFAPSVSCSAHVLDDADADTDPCTQSLTICFAPDDEAAGWAGDFRLSWDDYYIDGTLEHSGPVVSFEFANTVEGRADLLLLLRIELGE